MIKYSKPLGNLIKYKDDFFLKNKESRNRYIELLKTYSQQPLRHKCKNCDDELSNSSNKVLTIQGVQYIICKKCGHFNGAHEDSDEFCNYLYAEDDGNNYSANYISENKENYLNRTKDIYEPKAEFLKDSLMEHNYFPATLCDFGTGAGYFLKAALNCGFPSVKGYEPSISLAGLGNAIINEDLIKTHTLDDIYSLVEECDSEVVSFIGVLEHLRNPRKVLSIIKQNQNIKFIYISVPLFSPTVIIESMLNAATTRHLAGGHTHLYTEDSINYICKEFGLKRVSEWWFGLEASDLYRSISVTLRDSEQTVLEEQWNNFFLPMIDEMQAIFDKRKICSEVHMLLQNNPT